jgi:hypothetical protein
MCADAGRTLGDADENQAGPQEPATELAVGQDLAITLAQVANPVVPIFYIASRAEGTLRQTEILCNVRQHKVTLESLNNPDGVEVEPIDHELAIVVSQDCDLERDFIRREELRVNGTVPDRTDAHLLPTVLFCEAYRERTLQDMVRGQNDSWQKFHQNKLERYQFLRAVEADGDRLGIGLDAMGIDFKRYFTVPTAELYAQLEGRCTRRCRLAPQYLEHFSLRFSNYLSRVGLPKNHHDL